MEVEWDDAKAEANLAKHGVAFADVARYRFDSAIRVRDERYAYGEDRYISVGYIGDRLHVIVYTDREDAIRLISMRKANSRERVLYEKTQESAAAGGVRRKP